MNLSIRKIRPQDYSTVATIIKTAFQHSAYGYNNEVELVDKIRQQQSYQDLEWVACYQHQLVGHILFSHSEIKQGNQQRLTGLCLAPLAVLPEYQSKGIGSELIKTLDKELEQQGFAYICLVGDEQFYSRFGYQRASHYQIQFALEIPAQYCLIKPLGNTDLAKYAGTLFLSSAFNP